MRLRKAVEGLSDQPPAARLEAGFLPQFPQSALKRRLAWSRLTAGERPRSEAMRGKTPSEVYLLPASDEHAHAFESLSPLDRIADTQCVVNQELRSDTPAV